MTRLLSFCVSLLALLAAGPGHAQFYHIDLQAEKLEVPIGPWQVARVLDLRADRSRLGPVRQGLANEHTSANFSQPLATELLRFVQAQLPPRPGTRPVLMRVFTLTIDETMRANSEHAEAELVADFLEPQPDSTFRVLLAVGETTERNGLDVTKHHAANLALLLQHGLRQLAALPASTTTTETLNHADALAGRGGAMSQRFGIQAAAKPKRGFYRTFQEFRDNAPSEADHPFAIDHILHAGKRWEGHDEARAVYLPTEKNPSRIQISRRKVWGVSDGQELLIAYRGSFYQLQPAADGRSYTFFGPPLLDEETTNNRMTAAVVGGVVGGAVGGAVVAAVVGAASAGPPVLPYEVHLASGRVVAVPDATHPEANGAPTIPDTARVYVYRRAESPKNRVATLLLANRSPLSFPTRQWTSLKWTDRRQELKICAQVEAGPAACHQFIPDFSQPSYVECVVPADGSPPSFRPVPAKEGAFEIRRLRMLAKTQQ